MGTQLVTLAILLFQSTNVQGSQVLAEGIANHPAGAKSMTAGRLGTEFLTELIEALLAVILLSQRRLTSFASRVAFVLDAGILATTATNVSYWNWYGFPASYTAAYMTTGVVGFICVGLAAAAVMKERVPAAMAAAA